jgi:DNA-binding FadR family transcriptional regulator
MSFLKPLSPSRNLVSELVDRVADEIRSGRLAPGARLPTEFELMAATGVSRTVVREAVAALRAEGLVVTRQGLGAFVASEAHKAAFRIVAGPSDEPGSISNVVSVLELRLAVEVEAAALAAERAGRRHVEQIETALMRIDAAVVSGGSAVAEDFALHRAIAQAADNPQFANFLDFLGRHFIPRQTIRAAEASATEQRAYLERIQKDHARIVEAIRSGNSKDARNAMRAHLTKSLHRYRGLASERQEYISMQPGEPRDKRRRTQDRRA